MPDDLTLFPDDDVAPPMATAAQPDEAATPRVLTPNRTRLRLRPLDLESLLPHDHRARAVWDFVLGADLRELYAASKAVEGGVGRSATDPRLLLALWRYATVEGVGSARALARLCREHHAYQWRCGGVPTNYHTLADFRVAHSVVLERLLTASVATLMAAGLVELKRVSAGGTTVYLPVPEPCGPKREPHCPLPDDSPVLAAWRVRMGTDEAKAISKERAATAECVNALARERGLQRVRVRGRAKVLAVLLWYAVAHNLLRIVALTAASAAAMT